jgi:hypothetical protein
MIEWDRTNSSMPFYAAGDKSHRMLTIRVISSFTPSIRAIPNGETRLDKMMEAKFCGERSSVVVVHASIGTFRKTLDIEVATLDPLAVAIGLICDLVAYFLFFSPSPFYFHNQ